MYVCTMYICTLYSAHYATNCKNPAYITSTTNTFSRAIDLPSQKWVMDCKIDVFLFFIFLDRHYVWRSHDPMSCIWPSFFNGLIIFYLPLFGVFRFCIFLYLCLFLTSFFFNYFMEQIRRTRTYSALELPVLIIE